MQPHYGMRIHNPGTDNDPDLMMQPLSQHKCGNMSCRNAHTLQEAQLLIGCLPENWPSPRLHHLPARATALYQLMIPQLSGNPCRKSHTGLLASFLLKAPRNGFQLEAQLRKIIQHYESKIIERKDKMNSGARRVSQSFDHFRGVGMS